MKIMECDQPFLLLSLPTEVVEEILLYLRLPDRKNVRLTCKRLCDLCNSVRFCKDEMFVWRETYMHQGDMLSDLMCSTRCHLNLVIRCKRLQSHKVLPFFEKHGRKVHSLSIVKCITSPCLLNALLTQCEELCSLTLLSGYPRYNTGEPADSGLNLLAQVIYPKVVSLKLSLPLIGPWVSFHQISSIFPNVKYLDIRIAKSSRENLTRVAKCGSFFNNIMKFGNLESLNTNIPLTELLMKGSQFFDALPNLKDVVVDFGGDREPSKPEKWCSCFRNISTVNFYKLRNLRTPANWLPLLKNTELNHLALNLTGVLTLNQEIFRTMSSSQLKIISIHAHNISVPSTESPDDLNGFAEFNQTVTDLTLIGYVRSTILLQFSTHFRALVHLSLSKPIKNTVLQRILECQENLRSLSLECFNITEEGFCGMKDGPCNYSLMNLQKLEHLELRRIRNDVIDSERFKSVFNFPQLKYLRLSVYDRRCWSLAIPLSLLKHLINLEAVFLEDTAIPSASKLSWLFKKLKRLNYLRFAIDSLNNGDVDYQNWITFINSKHIPIESATYNYLYGLGQAHYDYLLDRLVITNCKVEKTLLSPKISSFEINWIKLHVKEESDDQY